MKLLRVLQEREYEPLGGVKTVRADVRIVAATNQRLAELVSKGEFRDDLYFRLAVVRLSIPSLKDRREDVPYLVEHFIRRFNAKRGKNITGVSPAVMETLMRYDYPGNVRELENIIEYAFVLCHGRIIEMVHLPEEIQAFARKLGSCAETPGGSKLQWAEADMIRSVLDRVQGRVGRAARELGISRTTLWRKMKRYGISHHEFR